MSSRLNLFLALALLVGGSLPAAVVAQGPGGPGGRGGFGMFGGGGGGDLMLLQNDDVRTELGLVDDQVEKIRGIGEKMREEMRSMFSGFRDLGDDERRAKFEEMRTKMEDRAKEVQKEMDEILLPHQSKRLKQIGRQLRSRQGGSNGISPDAVATELKLSDEQKEKLREKAQEVEKKLREKVAKMRKEAEDDLLSVLTPEQRAEWRDLIGEPFEMQFRGFGGRGGPGGQGGQGGPGGRGNPQGN
jgi:Spy/CpxP family protein refolding chaperone